jgi:type VI secretion system protein ImpE
MTARDALNEGQLFDAITLQEAALSSRPADPTARLFLVELLTLASRYHEARDHLLAIQTDAEDWPASRRSFRRLIRCASRRERGARPTLPDTPPAHVRRRWKACKAIRRVDTKSASEWVDAADAVAPHLMGHIDGREFDGLRDADDRFSSVLEVFAGGEYSWVPWEQVRRLVIQPGRHVLDRALRPARLLLTNGIESDVLLPLVYPSSTAAGDEFALGLETDHVATDDGPVQCVGAKLLLAGEEEIPLGECRQIDLRAQT